MTTIEIRGEFIELATLIKLAGISSTGGQAKLMIENNEVKVNGEIDTRKRAKIRPGDLVEIFDYKISVVTI